MYHVLNRANAQIRLFDHAEDYEAFERVLVEAHQRLDMRTLSYCLMPNHWHMVLWPRRDGDLSEFMRWLTVTHAQRWHAFHGTVGSGHIYQGRFKSFPIQSDEHLLTVYRYVERNALRAGLVQCAEDWRWCSLWRRRFGSAEAKSLLVDGPVFLPGNWTATVNSAQTQQELSSLVCCISRGQPFGSQRWTKRIASRLGLGSTLRPRGRPRRG